MLSKAAPKTNKLFRVGWGQTTEWESERERQKDRQRDAVWWCEMTRGLEILDTEMDVEKVSRLMPGPGDFLVVVLRFHCEQGGLVLNFYQPLIWEIILNDSLYPQIKLYFYSTEHDWNKWSQDARFFVYVLSFQCNMKDKKKEKNSLTHRQWLYS